MSIKRFLILAPLIISAFLLQSYLWVPTYEQQTRGNPDRLNEFISGSIGDASILNPVLSADASSSQIEGLVFEGLIDRDENLHFRGRLAVSWDISEEVYFYVNENADVPEHGKLAGEKIIDMIKKAIESPDLYNADIKKSLKLIRGIILIPAREDIVVKKEKNVHDIEEETTIHVSAPSRIKLVLDSVDQDFFRNLSAILGKDYFLSFKGTEFIKTSPERSGKKLVQYANELLPAIEQNPVIVFHLRKGVRFHDGHVFDANDVKFTYEVLTDPRSISPRISDYEPVKSVEAVDPLTVRIVYKMLYSPALGTWSIGILPEHLLNQEALRKEAESSGKDPEKFNLRQSRFNQNPVGCGPFVFKEWKSDQYIYLERFDGYWEGPPQYKKYYFRVIPDLLTQEMEFYAGTIDSYSVQPHQVKRLANDNRFQSFSGTAFGYTYIGYNMRRPPFDDPRVRRALGMAIDVNKILEYVIYEEGEPITGPFVKQTDYYNQKVKPLPYDPEGALKLLEEAGWKKNSKGRLEKNGKKLEFTLITNNGNDIRKAVMAIAQDAWKQIGIEVNTDLLEWSVFIQERVDKADFDALILGWQMGIEPDLYQIWHSSQTNPYQLNFVGFKNQEADDLIIKIRQEYDIEKQIVYSHRLHEIIANEQPYTFLYVGKWTAVLDKRIVIRENGLTTGKSRYRKIQPTKTGNYSFYFNKWIKLPEVPDFTPEG